MDEAIQGPAINILTHENPTLNKDGQEPGSVTKDEDFKQLEKGSLEIWYDFSYENIMGAFGDILEGKDTFCVVTGDRTGSCARIVGEEAVDDLTSWWNAQVCRKPLKKGSETIHKQLGLPPSNITFQLNKGEVILKDAERTMRPDWVIFLRDDDGTTPIVHGENKLSSKWNSDVSKIPAAWRGNWIWPFRQVLSYCVVSSTRYGCIMTPDELVVTRCYLNGSSGRDQWNVQYLSIPWENSGRGNLTVNLGIWALGLMALNSGHRPIASKANTLPLNVWWTTRTPKGKEAYEHHLSSYISENRPINADIRSPPDSIPGVEEISSSSRRSKRTRRVSSSPRRSKRTRGD
ncbi:hypothetical protein VHEMI10425 [[Torrubiella] hemipterigena]|uniref:Uncharacterized protein n=1 Tax=[Torrubiella] hemipterigena TaxID=1531966 RepID=A0A0A1TS45_9HYPO|nr:hypothetical protein VHEMI10425 [[Torrubiella] hemipterigena]